jgi:hypothetical protein
LTWRSRRRSQSASSLLRRDVLCVAFCYLRRRIFDVGAPRWISVQNDGQQETSRPPKGDDWVECARGHLLARAASVRPRGCDPWQSPSISDRSRVRSTPRCLRQASGTEIAPAHVRMHEPALAARWYKDSPNGDSSHAPDRHLQFFRGLLRRVSSGNL